MDKEVQKKVCPSAVMQYHNSVASRSRITGTGTCGGVPYQQGNWAAYMRPSPFSLDTKQLPPPLRREGRMSKPELPSNRSPESHDAGRASPASSLVHTVWDFIRPQPWVINNLRQRKSQKLLFRSWLPAWGALLIILPNPWLRTIGNLYVESAFSCTIFFGLTVYIRL